MLIKFFEIILGSKQKPKFELQTTSKAVKLWDIPKAELREMYFLKRQYLQSKIKELQMCLENLEKEHKNKTYRKRSSKDKG